MAFSKAFTAFASSVARAAGRPSAFADCIVLIVVWAVSGPVFHFSDTWQFVIKPGTTIVTFLMVFLIQNTQNRDGAAIQAKLDELIRASKAQNRYIGIESLIEDELAELRERCASRAEGGKLDEAQAAAEEAADARRVRPPGAPLAWHPIPTEKVRAVGPAAD
ncbi:low affinity iron permease family protein [Methylobacterium planeticum]|uniref:Low affinity iron permease family protein n=1 Tax=Methylobacterium planeticum TaxID=2615211 RepID=A0A6N6MEV4_9HYPH|nr:low affinity iron permease family protein [Methylobacterium planeticum]KAB1069335.1 low affinity iron permease family protein [Methylobacterium planeticum]